MGILTIKGMMGVGVRGGLGGDVRAREGDGGMWSCETGDFGYVSLMGALLRLRVRKHWNRTQRKAMQAALMISVLRSCLSTMTVTFSSKG